MNDDAMMSRRVALGLLSGAALALPAAAQTYPPLHVSKDPNCGCCEGWVAHMRRNGFTVTVTPSADMAGVKARLGVPSDLESCHTAEIGGYVIEGHVPASAVARLLYERPAARGLSAPGMPIGSPGMEGGEPEVFEVVLFATDGRRTFARYKGDRQV